MVVFCNDYDNMYVMGNAQFNDDFKNKYGPYALIAGGSDGLGFAFAQAAAKRGVNLVLIARNKERLEASAAKLRDVYNVDITTIAADMADYEKVKESIEDLGVSIGLLIYNAAYAPIGLFENLNEKEISLAESVNVAAPLKLAKLLSEQMIQKKRGGIILMSSLSGEQGSPNIAVYAATKSFNKVLAEGLWSELKPHGIDVIASCAGAIITPGYQQAKKSGKTPGALTAEKVAEKTIKSLGKSPVVIPGAVNKIARFLLTRLLSRKAAIKIMSKNTGGLS